MTEWISVGLSGTSHMENIRITVNFSDSLDNIIQFRGKDHARNGPVVTPEFKVLVDVVGFRIFRMSPWFDEKQEGTTIPIEIEISNVTVGLDPSSLYYRYGTEGEGSLGDWQSMNVELRGENHVGWKLIGLKPGRLNVIQFKASNMEGREELSQLYWIWVNEPPVAVIVHKFLGEENGTLRLSGLDSTDPDDSELNYTWYLTPSTEPLSHKKKIELETRNIPFGNQTFVLVVRDPWGLEDIEEITLDFVGPPKPTEQGSNFVLIFLVLILLLTIVLVSLAVWYNSRRGRPPIQG